MILQNLYFSMYIIYGEKSWKGITLNKQNLLRFKAGLRNNVSVENANIRWDGLCNVSIDDYL